jgi:hypothetical protein
VKEPILTTQPIQRIVLTNRKRLNPLSILEIKVYDVDGQQLTGVPTSSSVRDNDMIQHGPQYVNDTKLDRIVETRVDGIPEWIQVNLKHEYVLSKVEIYNRIDCCHDEFVGSEVLFLNEQRAIVQSIELTQAKNVYVFTQ